jgi:hypothetical protein
MSEATWQAVGRALLGSWPERVTTWGKNGIAAYVEELQARGVTPDAALVAIRLCPAGQAFPPSAPQLAGLTRRDPGRPTWPEAYQLIYGPRGVLRARPPYPPGGWNGNELEVAQDELAMERAFAFHPLLGAFIRSQGLKRLRLLEVDDPEYGELRRRELGEDWDRFAEANEGREVASLVAGRSGDGRLTRLDPLAALGMGGKS